jgi:large subunit ribosomal protein L14e
MIEIGRICLKLAGRDAGRDCVIVDILDNNYVLIDGNVRRRKCNVFHLEPKTDVIKIKKGASHEEIKKEFSKLKLDVWDTKKKEKTERPRKIRGKKKADKVEEEKPKKKGAKKNIDAKVVSVTDKEKAKNVPKKKETIKKVAEPKKEIKKGE